VLGVGCNSTAGQHDWKLLKIQRTEEMKEKLSRVLEKI